MWRSTVTGRVGLLKRPKSKILTHDNEIYGLQDTLLTGLYGVEMSLISYGYAFCAVRLAQQTGALHLTDQRSTFDGVYASKSWMLWACISQKRNACPTNTHIFRPMQRSALFCQDVFLYDEYKKGTITASLPASCSGRTKPHPVKSDNSANHRGDSA